MEDIDQIIEERFKEIPNELKEYIVSNEFLRKVNLVAKKYRLSPDQETDIRNQIIFVLLVLDSEDNLHTRFEEAGISPEVAANMALDVSEYVLKKVDEFIAHKESDLIEEEPAVAVSEPEQLSKTQEPIHLKVTEQKTPASMESIKQSILAHIENPPRTVIKRYVLEHEPITDPEHLIDDTIDDRIKLSA